MKLKTLNQCKNNKQFYSFLLSQEKPWRLKVFKKFKNNFIKNKKVAKEIVTHEHEKKKCSGEGMWKTKRKTNGKTSSGKIKDKQKK